MKNPWVIIGVIVAVLIGGSVWYSGNVAKENNEGITFSPHVKGAENATVVLTEYSDFQCPACGAFQPVLKEVMTEFGDNLQLEFKHFPLVMIHPGAEPAARAAEAAGQQGKFFEFHDLLFANQKTWTEGSNPMSYFLQYAEELGLDIDLFKRHYNAPVIKDKIKKELREGQGLDLTGTPTFFLNGEKMTFKTIEDFKSQIAAATGATSTGPKVEFGI